MRFSRIAAGVSLVSLLVAGATAHKSTSGWREYRETLDRYLSTTQGVPNIRSLEGVKKHLSEASSNLYTGADRDTLRARHHIAQAAAFLGNGFDRDGSDKYGEYLLGNLGKELEALLKSLGFVPSLSYSSSQDSYLDSKRTQIEFAKQSIDQQIGRLEDRMPENVSSEIRFKRVNAKETQNYWNGIAIPSLLIGIVSGAYAAIAGLTNWSGKD